MSLHCNLSEDTYHLLNEDRLNMMKKDATLINCARGPVIDEVALTNFLQANENFRCAAGRLWRLCFWPEPCFMLHPMNASSHHAET